MVGAGRGRRRNSTGTTVRQCRGATRETESRSARRQVEAEVAWRVTWLEVTAAVCRTGIVRRETDTGGTGDLISVGQGPRCVAWVGFSLVENDEFAWRAHLVRLNLSICAPRDRRVTFDARSHTRARFISESLQDGVIVEKTRPLRELRPRNSLITATVTCKFCFLVSVPRGEMTIREMHRRTISLRGFARPCTTG